VRDEEGGEIALPKQLLAGRYVFVGLTAPGLLDLRPTPLGAVFPGVEIHATVMENLLAGRLVVPPRRSWTWALALAAAVAVALALGRVRGALSALPLPLVAGLLLLVSTAAFRAGAWLPLAAPLLAAALAFVSVQTVDYATEGRQRRFLKHAFRHYLSPTVIEKILEDPSRLALGGERKELTIFFSDLADFTTLSEKLEPEALTSLLNLYLTEMTDVIQGEGGTVDKYEGDAIIAFWNAPLDQPDHATCAVRAALGCLAALDRLNPRLAELSGSALRMRIGVHTGTAVVGNMGSRDRFDYTVLGDAANLASRLEGTCKVFGVKLLVSEETFRRVGGTVPAREIGLVRVAGRRTPTRVFEPGAADTRSFDEALRAWYQGDLERAAAGFARLPDDPAASAYRVRCEELRAAGGTPAEWSGVWEMRGK
jgi:adenylate cyclase